MHTPVNRLRSTSVITALIMPMIAEKRKPLRPLITKRGAWTNNTAAKNHGLIKQCCVCHRVLMSDGTYKFVLHDLNNTSHGLCPRCAEREKAHARELCKCTR